MPKFRHGLVLGAIVGTAVALLTAKKTGADRQRDTAAYLNDVTSAVQDVSASAGKLQTALGHLLTQLQTTVPTVQKQVERDIADFQFQAQPRLNQINETLTTLQADAAGFTDQKVTNKS
jgi:gas vesicle protein